MLPFAFTNQTAQWILTLAYFIWLIPEVIYTFFYRSKTGSFADDPYSAVVIKLTLGTSILLAYWLAHVQTWALISWHPVLLFAVGIILMISGVAFRWYAIRVLGKYFNVILVTQPGQTVMRDGPYRLIRHPSYTGTLITLLGIGIALTNWLCLISVPLIGLLGYSYRASVEERMLIAGLGEPYREYMKDTKRFIPFVY